MANVSFPRRRTLAREGVLKVHAASSVLAGRRGALVDVDSTGGARPSGRAFAVERSSGLHASAPVLAGSGGARIVHHLAVGPRESFGTSAEIGVGSGVLASAPVEARLVRATII